MKDFFVKIDRPLEISHRILETWSGDGYHFVRGEADMAKKRLQHARAARTSEISDSKFVSPAQAR
jgi:hypothetical protein